MNLPACLIIMDGFGIADPSSGNAISVANTPNIDALLSGHPKTLLEASGNAVGLPKGQMGNSEVGHLNIGAGRIVHQELTRLDKACEDGSIATNPVLVKAFDHVNSTEGAALHLMGLLSDGGVHSSNAHLFALIEAAKQAGVSKIMVHCFMDGRDVPPTSGIDYVRELVDKIESLSSADCDIKIASISGRYYAMDRDNRWERVEKAYRTIVEADNLTDASPVSVMQASYDDGVTDEFVVPIALDSRGVVDGDSVIFFNFRPDRAREITRAIVDDTFTGFERGDKRNVMFVCLTEYDPTIKADVAFAKEFPSNVLADVLADAGLKQYHIAETEKYAHVTFFLNGGVEEPKKNETRKLIPSPKVATYDLKPEMSEPEVAEALSSAIRNGEADVYIVNFANCDMVGHTGSIPAAVSAVEAVDSGVGQVLDAIKEAGGIAFVTADHGNADCMVSSDGSPHTAHTTAPVPFVLVDARKDADKPFELKDEQGKLADIAPTLLEAIGIEKPVEMTGNSLLA